MSGHWRIPKRLHILGHLVSVQQVTDDEMKDAMGDHEGGEGLWEGDLKTIFVLRKLSPPKKNRVFWHEVQHALVDLFDAD